MATQSEETRLKRGESLKRYWASEEGKARRKELSEKKKGIPFTSGPLSDEHRKKVSEGLKSFYSSEDGEVTKKVLSDKRAGVKKSSIHRKNISRALKKWAKTEEGKNQLSYLHNSPIRKKNQLKAVREYFANLGEAPSARHLLLARVHDEHVSIMEEVCSYFGYSFEKELPFSDNSAYFDFYVNELKIDIEFDDVSHETKRGYARDIMRDRKSNSEGISVIRIPYRLLAHKECLIEALKQSFKEISGTSAGPQVLRLGDDIVRYSEEIRRVEDKEPQ
jgi:very-short-patch-repair endonuclease/uncharacterized protein YdaU (DUF1376 family)